MKVRASIADIMAVLVLITNIPAMLANIVGFNFYNVYTNKLRRAEATNIGVLLGLFIFILIGIVLLPVIVSQVNNLTSGTAPAVTGTNATLLNLVPLFYILVLIIVPAVVAYKIYKD
ncbi:VP1/VP3 family protein [Sulfolobus islandicus Y.G.57.14]|uniref:VP1/VP3 family protein n=1 Tax=Saccharolobus islandicus (strain Y.G.57.14 / Yellowstone \|nr:VP1/VP3 family protein [Sulfolobus islandicus]ACP46014.1 VP1/VP3 family protein [Sulfolobus islandicus Y.G.57.14]